MCGRRYVMPRRGIRGKRGERKEERSRCGNCSRWSVWLEWVWGGDENQVSCLCALRGVVGAGCEGEGDGDGCIRGRLFGGWGATGARFESGSRVGGGGIVEMWMGLSLRLRMRVS